MNRHEGARSQPYSVLALLVAVAAFQPSNALPYGVGLLVLLVALVWARDGVFARRTLIVCILFAIEGCTRALIDSKFSIPHFTVAGLTWSSSVLILCLSGRSIARFNNSEIIALLVPWLLLFEGAFGIAQAIAGFLQEGTFDLATGDRVAGTIHPYFRSEASLSNPMYAINMAGLLMASMALPASPTRNLALITGVIALALASVIHVLVASMVALITAAILSSRLPRRLARNIQKSVRPGVAAVGITAAILAVSFTALPRNMGLLVAYVSAVGSNPKVEIVDRVLRDWRESPQKALFGYGPGQLNGRGSLIATGRYFGGYFTPRSVPLVPNTFTEYQSELLVDLWARVASVSYFGSTQAPWASWLSVLAEWGLGRTLFGLLLLFGVLRQIRKGPVAGAAKFAATALVVLLVLVGIQENYWEVPQAVALPLLLARIGISGMYAD